MFKVNQRIGSRTSVLNKLESRVKEIGWSLGVRFGQEELSFHFLVHNSLQYCIQVCVCVCIGGGGIASWQVFVVV